MTLREPGLQIGAQGERQALSTVPLSDLRLARCSEVDSSEVKET